MIGNELGWFGVMAEVKDPFPSETRLLGLPLLHVSPASPLESSEQASPKSDSSPAEAGARASAGRPVGMTLGNAAEGAVDSVGAGGFVGCFVGTWLGIEVDSYTEFPYVNVMCLPGGLVSSMICSVR